MELNVGQLYLIGLVATLLAQLIKLIGAKWEWYPSRRVITLIAFAVSIGLALVFWRPVVPAETDPMALAGAILSAATAVLGAAVGIYNVILESLLKALGEKIGRSLTP
jgi:uncharacterized membrane protein